MSELVMRTPANRDFLGGNYTELDLATSMSYYQIPASTLLTPDIVASGYQEVSRFFPEYIPAHKSLTGGVYYRGLYVSNVSANRVCENVQFWIDGGSPYIVSNTVTPRTSIFENSVLLNSPQHTRAMTPQTREYHKLRGVSRSSLFGNIKLDTYVPTDNVNVNLLEINEEGVAGAAFNLANVRFTSAPQRVSLPTLRPGDFVGLFLRATVNFDPHVKEVTSDYSFLHLSWVSTSSSGNRRTVAFPSQSQSNSTQFLPSVRLKFETRHDRMMVDVMTKVDSLYRYYPPYFRSYLEDDDTNGS